MTKACVILGAGASKDAWNSGSPKNDDYEPPLASELFKTGVRGSVYHKVAGNYPRAYYLANLLAPYQGGSGFNLEEKLREFAYHDDDHIRDAFKEVPPYLRDVLWEVSRHYVEMPGTHIELASRLVAQQPHHTLFLSLNYDTFLETALSFFGNSYGSISGYVSKGLRPMVIKLHGSINWFRLIRETRGGSWEKALQDLNINDLPGEDVLVKNDITQAKAADENGEFIYPVLTAPLVGKDASNFVCPPSHVRAAKAFLADCRKFLIIGSSGLDDDLMQLLQASIPPDARPLLHVVDQGTEANKVLGRFSEKVQAFGLDRRNDTRVAFQDGFRGYVVQGGLQSFCAWERPGD